MHQAFMAPIVWYREYEAWRGKNTSYSEAQTKQQYALLVQLLIYLTWEWDEEV